MKKEITYDELLAKIPNKYILTIVAGEEQEKEQKKEWKEAKNLYHLQNMIIKILK